MLKKNCLIFFSILIYLQLITVEPEKNNGTCIVLQNEDLRPKESDQKEMNCTSV